MDDGERDCIGGDMLRLCEWIVKFYARYTLLRCARFTNSRSRAEQIGIYTLITTCLLARELECPAQLGLLVDTMSDIIGRDMAGDETSDRPRDADEPLVADEKLRKLAEALNGLDRFAREVLVFRHIERMSVAAIARLLHESREQLTARIARAEELLAEHLGELHVPGSEPNGPDVPSLLAEFAVSLDTDWVRNVGQCALAYLAGSIAEDMPLSDRANAN